MKIIPGDGGLEKENVHMDWDIDEQFYFIPVKPSDIKRTIKEKELR